MYLLYSNSRRKVYGSDDIVKGSAVSEDIDRLKEIRQGIQGDDLFLCRLI